MKYIVYDSRTNAILYEGDQHINCLNYIFDNIDEDSEDFRYIRIDTIK